MLILWPYGLYPLFQIFYNTTQCSFCKLCSHLEYNWKLKNRFDAHAIVSACRAVGFQIHPSLILSGLKKEGEKKVGYSQNAKPKSRWPVVNITSIIYIIRFEPDEFSLTTPASSWPDKCNFRLTHGFKLMLKWCGCFKVPSVKWDSPSPHWIRY